MAFPPAYASANPAVNQLFGNEMAINRAAAADDLARRQIQAQRAQQEAETIYRQQALRQQNEQQQLNAFLHMMTNAQRQAEGRNEMAGRERIAGLPYGPTALAESKAEREARIKLAEIAASRPNEWKIREDYQAQQDAKFEAANVAAQQAQLGSIADDLNKQVKQLADIRLKSHEDVDAPSLGKAFSASKRSILGYPGAVSGASKALDPSGTAKEHKDIDDVFLKGIQNLKAQIDKQSRGLIVWKNNRFHVNAAALGAVPQIRVPQSPPSGTNSVPALPPMTNAVPSLDLNDPLGLMR